MSTFTFTTATLTVPRNTPVVAHIEGTGLRYGTAYSTALVTGVDWIISAVSTGSAISSSISLDPFYKFQSIDDTVSIDVTYVFPYVGSYTIDAAGFPPGLVSFDDVTDPDTLVERLVFVVPPSGYALRQRQRGDVLASAGPPRQMQQPASPARQGPAAIR